MNSHNHPMLGSVGSWLYKFLGGIDVQEAAVGFDRILVRPYMTPEVGFCRVALDTVRGRLESAWHVGAEPGSYSLKVTIPANSLAEVILPVPDRGFALRECDQALLSVNNDIPQAARVLPEGILDMVFEGNAIHLNIGSGEYQFMITGFLRSV
jgi:hypothetical protein